MILAPVNVQLLASDLNGLPGDGIFTRLKTRMVAITLRMIGRWMPRRFAAWLVMYPCEHVHGHLEVEGRNADSMSAAAAGKQAARPMVDRLVVPLSSGDVRGGRRGGTFGAGGPSGLHKKDDDGDHGDISGNNVRASLIAGDTPPSHVRPLEPPYGTVYDREWDTSPPHAVMARITSVQHRAAATPSTGESRTRTRYPEQWTQDTSPFGGGGGGLPGQASSYD